jgi:hypothetical protein
MYLVGNDGHMMRDVSYNVIMVNNLSCAQRNETTSHNQKACENSIYSMVCTPTTPLTRPAGV